MLAGVSSAHVQQEIEQYKTFNQSAGLTFGISKQSDRLIISNILSGFNLCGQNAFKENLPMVCTTEISNHKSAKLEVEFMTDGTTASIAAKTISL
jgi:hypothetical protein